MKDNHNKLYVASMYMGISDIYPITKVTDNSTSMFEVYRKSLQLF